MIGRGMHPHSEDLPVFAERHFPLQVDVASETGRDQIAGLVLNPFDRTFGEDRRQDRNDVAGVHRDLVTETTAEVGADDPDLMLRQLRHHGHRRSNDVRGLRGHVHGQLAGRAIEVRDRAARLQRRWVRARIVQFQARHDVCIGEGLLRCLLVADLPIEDLVGVLVDLVVPDQRRTRVLRLVRVDDRRKLLVFHDDLAAGILGDVRIVGDNRSDLLALEANLVGRDDGLCVVRQGRHPG